MSNAATAERGLILAELPSVLTAQFLTTICEKVLSLNGTQCDTDAEEVGGQRARVSLSAAIQLWSMYLEKTSAAAATDTNGGDAAAGSSGRTPPEDPEEPLRIQSPASRLMRLDSADSYVIATGGHGHAAVVAKILLDGLAMANRQGDSVHFVFLGDYIDGGHESLATLSLLLIASLCGIATLLVGRHEALFPIPTAITGFSGRLDAELKMECARNCSTSASVDEVEIAMAETIELLRAVFNAMPVAAVIQSQFFCICGGLTPTLSGGLSAFESASTEQIISSVLSDPMDDDDEYQQDHNLLFCTNPERPKGVLFSFDAVCAFLRQNDLLSLIRGNSYVMSRDGIETNMCGRPWHYQYSPFDPGYRLFRKHPTTGLPSVTSIFSVPRFCGTNNNYGAVIRIHPPRGATAGRHEVAQSMEVKQFQHPFHSRRGSTDIGTAGSPRKAEGNSNSSSSSTATYTQPPGPVPNAFAWAQPLLLDYLRSALDNMLECTTVTAVPNPNPASASTGAAAETGVQVAETAPAMKQTEGSHAKREGFSKKSLRNGGTLTEHQKGQLLRFRQLCEEAKAQGKLNDIVGAAAVLDASRHQLEGSGGEAAPAANSSGDLDLHRSSPLEPIPNESSILAGGVSDLSSTAPSSTSLPLMESTPPLSSIHTSAAVDETEMSVLAS